MFKIGDWSIGKWVFVSVLVISFAIAGGSQAAEKGPIKIGFISPHTGNCAQQGIDMVDGFKMFLDEIDYGAGGRSS